MQRKSTDGHSELQIDTVRLVSGELRVAYKTVDGAPAGGSRYTFTDGSWVRTPYGVRKVQSTKRHAALKFSVSVRQSENDAPTVVASLGGREVVLTPPDPVIEGVGSVQVDRVQWRGTGGRVETGFLILPRAMSDGRKFPLVIQACVCIPGALLPDGNSTTACAAQALVARGIAVLQMDILSLIDGSAEFSHLEACARFVSRLDAAIGFLSNKGPIDSERVGLMGFSRAGFLVDYAVAYPGQIKLAAAVCVDELTGVADWQIQQLADRLGEG